MELLYTSSIPHGKIHAVAWSGMNLVAVSVSVQTQKVITESYKRSSTHQLLVFDPNRPWDFHYVSAESKSIAKQLDWSLDGTRLLTLSENNVVHVWRMKTQCINSWVAAHKHEPEDGSELIHASWLDCRPMATINQTKEDWNEAMEMQSFSPHLRMLLGEAFIMVTTRGKVMICSTSLPHCESSGGKLMAETSLPSTGPGLVVIAKAFVTQTGCILLGVGFQGGAVKVYSLTTTLHWTNQFDMTALMATELHSSRESGTISDLVMVPHADGCVVHVCFNNSQLYQWSVKDITRSRSYQSRREGVYTFPHRISSLTGSGLCLGSQDLSMQDKMSELLVFEEDIKENEGQWPVEVLVTVGEGATGHLTVLDRDSYKEIASHSMSADSAKEEGPPASKRPRLDGEEQNGSLLCLSPNAGCVLVVQQGTLHLYQLITPLLAIKDSSVPEVPRLSRLLSLAVVSSLSPWDLALGCARLQALQGGGKEGPGLVHSVLEHFTADYEMHSNTLKQLLVSQVFSAASQLHMSLEDGLLPSLSYRNLSRLYATASLVELTLPPSPSAGGNERGMARLQAVCQDNKMEENLNNLAEDIDAKEYALSPELAGHLQPHCHWLLEMAILVVSAIAEGEAHVNALLGCSVVTEDTASDSSEERLSVSMLDLLRQLLLLLCVWNKTLPKPIIPVSNGALALLFKVLTVFNLSPQSAISEELQSEVKSNLPAYQHPQLLSVTKAAYLQGFLSGLCSASSLPEHFQCGIPAPLRPGVQKQCTCLDPYSPLSLVVPQGMPPPWRDCFVEGQRDIVHGGSLSKALVQSARLKQCSRCRSWSLASEKLSVEQPPSLSQAAVQQWRSAWANSCFCAAPWTLQTNKTV